MDEDEDEDEDGREEGLLFTTTLDRRESEQKPLRRDGAPSCLSLASLFVLYVELLYGWVWVSRRVLAASLCQYAVVVTRHPGCACSAEENGGGNATGGMSEYYVSSVYETTELRDRVSWAYQVRSGPCIAALVLGRTYVRPERVYCVLHQEAVVPVRRVSADAPSRLLQWYAGVRP